MCIVRLMLVAGTLVVAIGCGPKTLGLPRTAVSVPAPDSSAWGEVKNHPTIDPPAQSLRIRFPSGRSVQLVRLIDDMDWCRVVVWAPDSSRVVFLVQDLEAMVYDVASQRLITTDLAARLGYPSENLVRDLAFSADGALLRFRPCKRSTGSCGEATSIPVPASDVAELAPWRRVAGRGPLDAGATR